jgi:trans-aconitate 2-methyltransferase
LNRVDLSVPNVVYDLGCGPGYITRRLAARWPGARVTGIDASPAMLAEARETVSTINWVHADVASWKPELPADLIFSNAALHWLDGHETLLPRLLSYLRPGGVLAMQMPRNYGEASHTSIVETVDNGPWRDQLRPLLRRQPVAPPETYAALLLPLVGNLDVWETVYLHILPGENPVVEWTSGTGLRPLLTALSADDRARFLAAYGQHMSRAYPPRDDGMTLFPFRRLFIAATR